MPHRRRSVRTASPLQRRIVQQIAEHVRVQELEPGTPLNQLELAEQLGVSRTPVRAALAALTATGLLETRARQFVVADTRVAIEPDERGSEDELISRIARDRATGTLPQSVSEAELMRRYGASRGAVTGALSRLATFGLVMRKPGFGWRFLTTAASAEERLSSYRFRLAIEPAALLEPGFAADPAWLASMTARHEQFLSRRWHARDAVAFFEMNAAFHLGLVSFSGNRFFIQATEQQNGLRRLRNYSWSFGEERVRVSCQEHLGIMAAIGAGRLERASELLRAHLLATAELGMPKTTRARK